MTISIIGSGNVAQKLAMAFENESIQIEYVYSRNSKNANKLAGKLYDTQVHSTLDFRGAESTVFFICVSDNAIEDIADAILLPDSAVLVHTSGTKSIDVLNKIKKSQFVQTGVFYPLMTLSAAVEIDFRTVPFCIESADADTEKVLLNLAKKLSKKTYLINSKERQTLHLAAVFASNFTNHLWALSREIVEEQDIDFEILKPIIAETLRKAMEAEHPADVQTGPALREDTQTLERHMTLLKEDKDLLKVYKTMSSSIQNWHNDEEE